MERDLLTRYLDEGLSLKRIGAMEGRDPSTVGYWVHRHGLVANGRDKYAPRGGLTQEQLEPLVEAGLSGTNIADQLGVSVSTVRHWLRRYGLNTAGFRRNREIFERATVAGLTRTMAQCSRHGPTTFAVRPDAGWRCLECRAQDVVNYRRRAKLRLVSEAGGRCRLCGYDRYQGALQFHHLDPSTKGFPLSRSGITRAFEELRLEASKCVLLCANCHAEVEAGFSSL
jgi:Homeodomain-like domain-containing protein